MIGFTDIDMLVQNGTQTILRLSKKRVGVRDDKVGMRPLACTDFVVDRTSIKAVGACPGGRQSHVDAIKAGLFLGNVV